MSRSNRGFTLIELVTATALAAMLMVAVLAVLTSINRDRERLAAAKSGQRQDQAPLIELLREDLTCSDGFKMTSQNTLVLQTTNSLSKSHPDWQSSSQFQRIDRPSTVTYHLVATDDGKCLVRQQEFSDETVPSSPIKSLLAFQVRRFEVSATAAPVAAGAGTRPAAIIPDPQLPRSVKVQVEFDDPSAGIAEILCLR